MVVALLALVGLFLSLYLTLYKLGYIVQLTCAVGSCERVQTSRWSVLFGIPVAVWGAGFYLTALACRCSRRRRHRRHRAASSGC